MVKVCRNCFNIFEGHIAIDHCPMRDCGGWELIEIDDMLVDLILTFWSAGISTAFCCSGHLYEFSFSPYVMFDEYFCEEGQRNLLVLRDKFIELNDRKKRVEISEVKQLRDMYALQVEGIPCGAYPKERLKAQNNFVTFFYEFLDQFDEPE